MTTQQQTTNSDFFVPIKFKTSVQLKSNELGSNIEEIIYTKLKNNLENMCSKHGYIKKDSIKIIKRSMGHIKIAHFNGNIEYDLQCVAEICNPAQGSIIKCKVKAKNSLGLLAEGFYNNIPIIQVIVPKISAGIQSEINIDTINVGDEINIEVCGKKYILYDKYISIIGKAIKDKTQYIKNIVDTNENDDDINENDKNIADDIPIFEDDKSDLVTAVTAGDEDEDETIEGEENEELDEEDEEDEDDDENDDEQEGGDEFEEFDTGFDDGDVDADFGGTFEEYEN